MTDADQIVRHLLENEEMDDFDTDVGLPTPLEGFLRKRGFQIAVPPDLGFDKIYNRGEQRLRIGHMHREDGVRKVEFYGGNIPLWTQYMTDEEILEMIDRNSRIGESEEDFEDETFDSETWKHVSLPPQENVNWKTVLKYFPNLPEIVKGNNITLRFEDNCLVIHHRLGPREWRYEVFRMENVVGDEWELVPLGSFNDYIEALQACVT